MKNYYTLKKEFEQKYKKGQLQNMYTDCDFALIIECPKIADKETEISVKFKLKKHLIIVDITKTQRTYLKSKIVGFNVQTEDISKTLRKTLKETDLTTSQLNMITYIKENIN